MSETLSDKIIRSHALEDSGQGEYVHTKIDALLGHDATIALLIHEFECRKLSVWDKSKVIFTNDHFSPAATAERADISSQFLRFSRQLNIDHLLVDRGICHQLLVEHNLCQPGSLIVGADSHTIMAGGLGACATGMGSTDILFALATGTIWLRKPKTIRIIFYGSLPATCSGRDIILELLRLLGEDGAQYRSLEFHDHAEPKLCQDDRFAIANMAVEIGAKFGIFVPDEITEAYCVERDGRVPNNSVLPDADADYEHTLEFDLSKLSPRIAKPWSPANVVAISEIDSIPINTAFLGSCSSGRIGDIQEAAEELTGKTIDPYVRLIIIPASIKIFMQALEMGYVKTLTEAGAVFNQSSCGPCGGIDKGVLGSTDVCISTSNRNFRGRMGHWESKTYLASARTVARAALQGKISGDMYS